MTGASGVGAQPPVQYETWMMGGDKESERTSTRHTMDPPTFSQVYAASPVGAVKLKTFLCYECNYTNQRSKRSCRVLLPSVADEKQHTVTPDA